ncbi:NusG domain II-containing protein [Candidatus Latescibacterota bacterium]
MFKYFTKGDIILVTILAVLSLASVAGMRNIYGGGKHVVVEVDSRHALELLLDSDVTESVTGPLGETVVSIENGTARIIESPCPHKYCIRMGKISRRAEIIVCVPNHVFMTIRGGTEEQPLDGVTQ